MPIRLNDTAETRQNLDIHRTCYNGLSTIKALNSLSILIMSRERVGKILACCAKSLCNERFIAEIETTEERMKFT